MGCIFCQIRDGVGVIPRWKGDGRGFDWKLVKGDPDRIRATADRIRAHTHSEQV